MIQLVPPNPAREQTAGSHPLAAAHRRHPHVPRLARGVTRPAAGGSTARLFMNVPIGDGKIGIEDPLSKAGDLVDLRAEMDLLVAISNGPQERNPCNAYTPTRLRVVVFGTPSA